MQSTQQAAASWLGQLQLELGLRGGRSTVLRRRHQGPLLVQRAFYPEGPKVAHLYLLHPPGGVVGGDELRFDLRVQTGAHVLLTTPGAGKFYRCIHTHAHQKQKLVVESGGVVEWFPQETILYSGARAKLDLDVQLKPGGCFIGWELFCLGRPGSGEIFDQGVLVSRLGVHSGETPLLLERFAVEGGGPLLQAPWGLRGAPVVGTLVATTQSETTGNAPELVSQLREARHDDWPEMSGEWRGITALEAPARATSAERQNGAQSHHNPLHSCIVARYLGHSVERAKAWFVGLWRRLRPLLVGRAACPPRIWAT